MNMNVVSAPISFERHRRDEYSFISVDGLDAEEIRDLNVSVGDGQADDVEADEWVHCPGLVAVRGVEHWVNGHVL